MTFGRRATVAGQGLRYSAIRSVTADKIVDQAGRAFLLPFAGKL
jgi:hypothetical protein